MEVLKQKEVPLGILIITSFLMLAEYYFDIAILETIATELKVWVVILSSFALVFGGYSLLRRVYRNVSRRTEGEWQYDVIGTALLVSMLFAGFVYGTDSWLWGWLFDNFYYAARATMYSAGAVYVYSTFYRAMRIRNLESGIMVFFAILVILGIAPIYGLISPQFLYLKDFLQEVGQLGAQRGFQLSTSIGLSILTLRIMVGMETAAIGLIPGVEEA